MLSLVYVSISSLKAPNATQEVKKIVEGSLGKNAAWDITGALVYTGVHFAQALEGKENRVEELMRSILSDDRHREVTIVRHQTFHERRFQNWNMAYAGRATYIGRPISSLLQPLVESTKHRAVDRLLDVMQQLVK